jgi:hypothetical protein
MCVKSPNLDPKKRLEALQGQALSRGPSYLVLSNNTCTMNIILLIDLKLLYPVHTASCINHICLATLLNKYLQKKRFSNCFYRQIHNFEMWCSRCTRHLRSGQDEDLSTVLDKRESTLCQQVPRCAYDNTKNDPNVPIWFEGSRYFKNPY